MCNSTPKVSIIMTEYSVVFIGIFNAEKGKAIDFYTTHLGYLDYWMEKDRSNILSPLEAKKCEACKVES